MGDEREQRLWGQKYECGLPSHATILLGRPSAEVGTVTPEWLRATSRPPTPLSQPFHKA